MRLETKDQLTTAVSLLSLQLGILKGALDAGPSERTGEIIGAAATATVLLDGLNEFVESALGAI